MDEMNTTAGYNEADLDSAWDSENDEFEPVDGEQEPLENQQQPDPEANDAPEGQGGGVNQPAEQQENPPELFTIMYNGKTEQLTREQMLTEAQKGRNYDHVKQELDTLRAERETNAGAVDLVKTYAQRMGMDVPQYLDWVRKQELMRSGMNEQQAAQTIQMDKRKADLDAQETRLRAEQVQRDTLLQQTRAKQEARQKDFDAFLKAYPAVDPKSIPKEVWDKVGAGVPLAAAYTMHENARLQAEIAALQQNKNNQQRTPGSLGANAGAELDEYDRWWNEDD